MSKTTNYNVKHKKVKDNVYGKEVHFVVGGVIEARDFIGNKLGVQGSPGADSHGEFISDDEGTFIVWLESWDGSPWSHGILAHEIFHAVKEIMAYVGMSLSDSSEEAYAYYTGFLMEEIKKFLDK